MTGPQSIVFQLNPNIYLKILKYKEKLNLTFT